MYGIDLFSKKGNNLQRCKHADDATTPMNSISVSAPLPELFEEVSLSLDDLFSSLPSAPAQVESDASTHHSGHSDVVVPAKQKKRVRRETRELKYLLEQTRELELRLEQLKKRVPVNAITSSVANISHETTAPSVWENIAERQLKERLQSEQMQKDLRAAHVLQTKFVHELKKQLKLFAGAKNLPTLIERKSTKLWDLLSDDSSGIYAEQLTQVAKTYLKMQQQSTQSNNALQFSTELTQGVDIMKRKPGDASVVFEMCCSTTVPFDVHVAGNAYWRLSADEAFRRQGSLHQDLDGKEDVVSTSFDLQVNLEGFTAIVREKHTCKRYINSDSEIIVWAGYADPVELNDTKFTGMQCRKTGWIKLQRVMGQPTASTWVEMYSEMTPLFKEGVDRNWQIHALLDSMSKAHSTTNEIYCQMVRELLVEEDWKAVYGSDAQAP